EPRGPLGVGPLLPEGRPDRIEAAIRRRRLYRREVLEVRLPDGVIAELGPADRVVIGGTMGEGGLDDGGSDHDELAVGDVDVEGVDERPPVVAVADRASGWRDLDPSVYRDLTGGGQRRDANLVVGRDHILDIAVRAHVPDAEPPAHVLHSSGAVSRK